MRRIVVLAFSLLAVARAQDGTDDKVTLAWRFAKGEVLRYELTNELTSSIADTETTQQVAFRWALEAKDVAADGTATIDLKYERVRLKAGGSVEFDFDSDRKDGQAEAEEDAAGDPSLTILKAFASLVGKTLTFKMSAHGRVLQVSGVDKLIDGMGESAAAFKQFYGEAQFKSIVQSAFGFLPERPVATGGKWQHSYEVETPMMGVMTTKGESTLRELKDGGRSALIRTTSKITADLSDGGMLELTEGTSEADTVWSVADGRLESSKISVTMKMSAGATDITLASKVSVKRLAK